MAYVALKKLTFGTGETDPERPWRELLLAVEEGETVPADDLPFLEGEEWDGGSQVNALVANGYLEEVE